MLVVAVAVVIFLMEVLPQVEQVAVEQVRHTVHQMLL
jgi:hypothetical protein